MGEYLLRQMIGTPEVSIASAGLGALVGHGADKNAIEVMNKHGVDISSHKPRQLDDIIIKQNELILVMESWQKKEIVSLYPYSRGRVHLLGKWNEVEIYDPYRLSKDVFIEVYEKIENACKEWCVKLC